MLRTLRIERVTAFRRLLPTDVYFWLKAVLLAGIAIQLARLLWTIVTPVGPFGDWRPPAPHILSAEMQSALLLRVDPFLRAGAPQTQAVAAMPSDLQLFGTRAGGAGVLGSAIIGQGEGDQNSFVVGEEVVPGIKLAEVAFDHVVLDRGGVQQSLYMPSADGTDGAQQGPATPGAAIAPGAAASAGAAMAAGLDVRPQQQNGQVTGVVIGPGSNPALFQAAGFQPGDVVVAVNGAKISSAIDAQQLQSSLVPGARLTLTVQRGSQTVPIALNLPAAR